ncbi:MAG TPA: multicopper oxidase domain-containing protein [Nitriliruptoraceae bacterium]|nr:multicopper oxidase domain-containing protein [Nitriliruptoraceae bacterium]
MHHDHAQDGTRTSGREGAGPARYRLSRRHFLRGTLAATVVLPLVGCDPDGDAVPTASPTTPGGTPTGTAAPGGPASPVTTGGGGGGGGAGTATAQETWNEPWVWRPSDWPGQPLVLNVVENQNPGAVIGFGNPSQVLFSYGGATPGPTIRMRGDEDLLVTLRNMLGLDAGITYVAAYPDPLTLTGYLGDEPLALAAVQQLAAALGNRRSDFCLGEHTNGVHTVHTTNLHSHGLHVRPGRNPDGTHSDNVILRLIPQADLAQREADPQDGTIECHFLREGDQINFLADDDQVGQAHFEFRLGDVMGMAGRPHPPGTHWYHPHSHGATHDQVASGMAGFLVVEGDVDDAIRAAMVPEGETDPGDPSVKTGPSDYRERLMLIQRVFKVPNDPDAPAGSNDFTGKGGNPSATIVNGNVDATTITMRPNAMERWRVLNGSVDGKGFRRFMVLEGRYAVDATGRLTQQDADGNEVLVTRATVEERKQHLWQLAMDGVTLVTEDGEYRVKDLADQGDGSAAFPLADFPTAPPAELVEDYVACFADGDSLRNCYVRPNEVYMGPANRTDVFFRAPPLEEGQDSAVYSVIALGVILHADTPLQGLMQVIEAPATRGLDGTATQPSVNPPGGPGDVVLATVVVSGSDATAVDPTTIELPEVPPYLMPITDDEPGLAAPGGGFRTRTVTYSGWGAAGMPLVVVEMEVGADGVPTALADPDAASASAQAFARFILDSPELEGLRYVRRFPANDGRAPYVLLPPNIRTMAIDGRKFDPTDPGRPRMHLDSAEEWVVTNVAEGMWGDTSADALAPAQFGTQYDGRVLTLAEGMEQWRESPSFQLLTRAVDHPFHIHQNPFWVIRIDVPSADGELHNILDEPRWMDVVPLPRHRGRVVFRSRFPDFVGTYVNHCHILLHEDNGMMQAVEVTPFDRATESSQDVEDARANYVVRDGLAQGGLSPAAAQEVTDLYGRMTGDEAWVANVSFEDPNHSTGQSYPGFEVTPPGT